MLIDNQHPEGFWVYPGHFHGKSGDDITDKVHATVFCCLMLEVFYRYAPSTSKNFAKNKGSKNKAARSAPKEEEELELEIF